MQQWELDVPVVLITFNRRDVAEKVFGQIKKVKPRQLFFVSDGPRPEKIGEDELVNLTRKIVDEINWDCELHTNFSEDNLGCDKRVETGITWAFETVDRAIILEDDCYPSLQFFYFCAELLEKYKNVPEIAYISGTAFIKHYRTPYSYIFSYLASTWGWATWKDRWNQYGFETEGFENKKNRYLKDVYTKENRENFLADVDRHFSKGSYPWDYIWQICMEGRLRIVPAVNLVCNIGFQKNSTHTLMKPKGYFAGFGTLKFPLSEPDKLEHDRNYSDEFQKRTKYHLWDRVIGKCKYIVLKGLIMKRQ